MTILLKDGSVENHGFWWWMTENYVHILWDILPILILCPHYPGHFAGWVAGQMDPNGDVHLPAFITTNWHDNTI